MGLNGSGPNGNGSLRLQGKVSIITGGGQGIGRATSIKFAKEGARVAVCDINMTAVAETLGGLRAARPEARIWAIFEPRSASSCRRVFQDDFANAFAAADEIVLAPVFRSTLPEAERLSIPRLVRDLKDRGKTAREAASIDDIVETVARERQPGDLVVVMSNGGFGGIHGKLLRALS